LKIVNNNIINDIFINLQNNKNFKNITCIELIFSGDLVQDSGTRMIMENLE